MDAALSLLEKFLRWITDVDGIFRSSKAACLHSVAELMALGFMGSGHQSDRSEATHWSEGHLGEEIRKARQLGKLATIYS